ncbi:hypothetical protein PG994_003996 [Apiospora phragmitis]|uniref:Uncharacterized protein n=1 Tax=Apiospora phragmitis TaxID=2905665 RepID=A0ABR1VZP7_9PEZI
MVVPSDASKKRMAKPDRSFSHSSSVGQASAKRIDSMAVQHALQAAHSKRHTMVSLSFSEAAAPICNETDERRNSLAAGTNFNPKRKVHDGIIILKRGGRTNLGSCKRSASGEHCPSVRLRLVYAQGIANKPGEHRNPSSHSTLANPWLQVGLIGPGFREDAHEAASQQVQRDAEAQAATSKGYTSLLSSFNEAAAPICPTAKVAPAANMVILRLVGTQQIANATGQLRNSPSASSLGYPQHRAGYAHVTSLEAYQRSMATGADVARLQAVPESPACFHSAHPLLSKSFTMPVIPVTFPGFTQDITIPFEAIPTSSLGGAAQPTETALTVDNVVAGLAAIGLNKGWVICLQIFLVDLFVFVAIGLLAACVASCTDSPWKEQLEEINQKTKELKELQSIIPDIEKGLDKALEKAKDETTGRHSDAASFRTCAE